MDKKAVILKLWSRLAILLVLSVLLYTGGALLHNFGGVILCIVGILGVVAFFVGVVVSIAWEVFSDEDGAWK